MPELVYKKSNELSDEEKQQYCKLYSDVFKRTKYIKLFDRQFLNNHKGYGYHVFYMCDEKMVGAYSVIPVEYKMNGEKLSVGLVVDTMIHEDYRTDLFMVKKMSKILYPEMTKDGIQFLLGFPNKKIYKYRLRLLKWSTMNNLSFYILPVNPKAFSPWISLLNPFFQLGNIISMFIIKLLASKKIIERPAEKVLNDDFMKFRYSQNYTQIDCSDTCKAAYIVYKEDNKNIAYLMDFYPVSQKNFYLAMRKTAKTAGKKIDGVIYVGNLPFYSILKIPSFQEPRKVHVAGFILDNNLNNTFMFNIKNWQISLADFDVR